MQEYKIFHVTRNLAKHAFELDDALYGSPLSKKEKDWALQNPELYVQRLKGELSSLETSLSNLQFVLACKENMEFDELDFCMTAEEVDAHCYHRFHHRSFNYAEKINYWLQSRVPEEIEINHAKAMRQLRVLEAAITDVNVSIVRFENYIALQK